MDDTKYLLRVFCQFAEHHIDAAHWPDPVYQWWRRERAAADEAISAERNRDSLLASAKAKLTKDELAALTS